MPQKTTKLQTHIIEPSNSSPPKQITKLKEGGNTTFYKSQI